MAESLTLAAPITFPAPASVTTYRVVTMLIDREPYARLLITVVGDNGSRVQVGYSDETGGTTAATLIAALNTANLSTKSLQKRVLEKLVADGFLPSGNVTGTPD